MDENKKGGGAGGSHTHAHTHTCTHVRARTRTHARTLGPRKFLRLLFSPSLSPNLEEALQAQRQVAVVGELARQPQQQRVQRVPLHLPPPPPPPPPPPYVRERKGGRQGVERQGEGEGWRDRVRERERERESK